MPDRLTSIDPASGDTVTQVPIADAEAVQGAADRAREAQPAWAKRSLEERLEIVEAFRGELVDERLDVARQITAEAGKPIPEALVADVMPTLETCAFLEREAEAILDPPGQRLAHLLLKTRVSRVTRDPLGVVAIVAPWNYPLAIPATQTLFALAAGNSVVLKPSEHTPGVGRQLVDLLDAAGVPEGVVQLVQGPGEPTGEALVDTGPDALVFTGSVETGEAIGSRLSPTGEAILELGGNDPMLVLDDANLERTARGATWAAFTNAGQTCAAVERLYAHESLVDDLVDRLGDHAERLRVGPGDRDDVDVGPLISTDAVESVHAHIEDALDRGARLVAGGDVREDLGPRFVEPTVLADVPQQAQVMDEETFGPILPVASVEDDEGALERANDSRYGLTASVWTTRPKRGQELAERLEAGTVTINDHAYTYAAAETPWGGTKDSGSGHTHGRQGLEALTRAKHVNEAPGTRDGSPWWFPYDRDLRALGDDGLELLYGNKIAGLGSLGSVLRRLLGP